MLQVERLDRVVSHESEVVLDQLDLTALTWQSTADVHRFVAHLELSDGVERYQLEATRQTDEVSDKYNFDVRNSNDVLLNGAVVWYAYPESNQLPDIEVGVRKKSQAVISGRGFYEKLLVVVQNIVTQRGQASIHTERFSPAFTLDKSAQPMTVEQWEGIFVPILKKHGYVATNNETWEKTYTPA